MSAGKEVFSFDHHDDVLIVTPNGSLMEFRDNEIRNAYNETYRLLNEPETRHLLIDFSNLQYFASTFVGMLIRLAKKARQGGGEAVLCKLSDNMQQMMKTLMLLENTKTDFFWVPFDSREAAIASLNAKQPNETAPGAPTAPAATEDKPASGGWAKFGQ